MDCRTAEDPAASRLLLRYWDAVAGRDRELAILDVTPDADITGFTASRDGSTFLYSYYRITANVMMIENLG